MAKLIDFFFVTFSCKGDEKETKFKFNEVAVVGVRSVIFQLNVYFYPCSVV